MADTDGIKRKIREMYELLDQATKIADIAGRDFSVRVPDLDVNYKLPPEKVDAMKTQYEGIRIQLRSLVGGLPGL